jgi:hypothetical protein
MTSYTAFLVGTALLLAMAVAGVYVVVKRFSKRSVRFSLRTTLAVFAAAAIALTLITQLILPRVRHRLAVEQIRRNRGWILFKDEQAMAEASRIGNYEVWERAQGNRWLDAVELHFSGDAEIAAAVNSVPKLIGVKHIQFSRGVTLKGIKQLFDQTPPMSLDCVSFFGPSGSDEAMAALKSQKRVHQVFGNTISITDDGLVSLADVPGLRILCLVEESTGRNVDRFTHRGFSAIGNLQSLEILSLRGYRLSDASVESFHALRSLKILYITDCIVPGDAIADLQKALPACEVGVARNSEPDSASP